MRNPFLFGKTVVQTNFNNRTQDIRRLESNFINGVNTILISPRRWGKSSLVRQTALKFNSSKYRIVLLDLFTARNEEDFYNHYATEVIKATSSKWEEWLGLAKQAFKNLRPKISIGGNPIQEFELSFELKDIDKNYKDILNLPERIAKDKGIKIIICIDEFQNLTNFNNPDLFQKRLRSEWQHHQQVCYCLYGSMHHTMKLLFTKQSNPFYKFGDLYLLQKIERKHWISYLIKYFKETNKSITNELANLIADMVEDHSYYVQQLAHITWNKSKKRVTLADVESSLNDMIDQNAILYIRDTELLNTSQVNFLKAVASGYHTELSSKALIQRFNLGTSANVVKTKESLLRKELIDVYEKKVQFIDPIYRLWFQKYMLG